MLNNEYIIKIYSIIYRLFLKHKFANLGNNSKIIYPLKIEGYNNITIGNNVRIGYKSRISALKFTGEKNISLNIEDNSCLGNFNHIICSKGIHIGKKVMTADRVYITDNMHSYMDIDMPILDQPIKQLDEVTIGDGSWIGENVCVLGAKIGKNCIIGANSVVTKDIPDFSVAVGIPAKVIKKYNSLTNKWDKV